MNGGAAAMRRTYAARVVLAALLTLSGCDACGGSNVIATLSAKQGEGVSRDEAASVEKWRSAEAGAQFRLGDGVRTDEASSALLTLIDASHLSLRPRTKIRFLLDGAEEGERGIDVITGEALVSVGASELRLRTHIGLAILSPGGQLVLTRDGDALRLRVEVGEARFRDSNGADQRVAAGSDVLLQIGMAVVRPAAQAEDAGTQPAARGVLARVHEGGVSARDPGAAAERALPPGEHRVASGTALRLPVGARVELVRGQDRATLEGAGDYVVGDDVLAIAKRGRLQVEARDQDVAIRVPGGTIITRAAAGGSRAVVRIGETEGTLQVELGQATIERGGTSRDLEAGDLHRFSLGNEGEPGERSEADERDERGPSHQNLDVRAGESFVVHAPELPIAVRIDITQKCTGEGVVELAQNKRTRGNGSANVLLGAGVRAYAVRCIDARGSAGRVIARGSVHVLSDAGTRDLPARAPTSLVDADGRNYTIYYQNQLPEVRVRWPNPPAADEYRLYLDDTPIALKSPEHVFGSGDLRDGGHRLTWVANTRKSRTASVEVRFDNTAPTASLSAPADRSFSPGDKVSIEGVVLPTWKVSVQNGTIERIGDGRFRGEVTTSPEHPDVAVKIVHPRLGTHYYLRRAIGSP